MVKLERLASSWWPAHLLTETLWFIVCFLYIYIYIRCSLFVGKLEFNFFMLCRMLLLGMTL